MADQLSSDLASLRIQRDVNPDTGSRWRWVVVVLLLGVAICAGLIAWRQLGARVFKTDVDVTEIRYISPAQAAIRVTSSGFVTPLRESKVGAKLPGRVAEVMIAEGDPVVAGQPLVRLEDAEARTAIASAKARAAAARARARSASATLGETRRQFERERALAAQGAGLRSLAEDLESRVAALAETESAAKAEAAAAAAEVEQREMNLGYLTITAPIDGVVTTRPVAEGELVGPGTPAVVEIADFASLVVETDVPEARLGLVSKGGSAEIVLDAYPTVRHRGKVAEIGSKVNRAKATVPVRVRFVDPIEGVLPEMAARVSFLAGELDAEAVKEPPKLFVPASAVVERDGQKVVFRIDGSKAALERVTLGPPMAGGFQLIEGPDDGTRVIASPPPTIEDGYPVREGTP